MPRVFISIGSNIRREHNIRSGLRRLRNYYAPLTLSKVYESQAVGFDGAPFLNLVLGFDTEDDVETVRNRLLEIETAHGRVRGPARFSPRTLDLDLLLYGELVKHEGELHIPRPEIIQYAFILRPLAEIAPDLRHPETHKTYRRLWREFGDRSQRLRQVKIALE